MRADSIRADLARKPDPFPAAAPSSASQPADTSWQQTVRAGASPTAAAEDECLQRDGESAADWVLSALSKSQNGASQGLSSNGSTGASSVGRSNGTAGPASWLSSGNGRPTADSGRHPDAAAGRRSAPAQDPEPWVHNGAAGSGAEALARATLRSASAPVDVPKTALARRTGPERRDVQRRSRFWGRSPAGHTDDEASSSEDSGEPWGSSDANTPSASSSGGGVVACCL